jgi:hypothetical protein
MSALSADLDALDRGIIEAGVLAAEVLARVKQLETQLAEHMKALRLMKELDSPQPVPGRGPGASYAGPVSAKAQARRRRIEASGLRVVKPRGAKP